jgi:hypothetical protein
MAIGSAEVSDILEENFLLFSRCSVCSHDALSSE